MLDFPKRPLSYNDDLLQMFGGSAKSVTFIVTHDCNMRCTYCTPGDTRILMADRTTKEIRDVVVGDTIYSEPEIRPSNMKNIRGEITSVDQVFKHYYDGDIVDIELESGQKLKLTPEHKVKYRSGMYKPACKLHAGDFLYTEMNAEVIPDSYMYDIGYFIGILVGDGSLTHHISKWGGYDMYRFRIAQKDLEITDKCRTILDTLNINYHMIDFKISEKYNLTVPAIFAASRGTYNEILNLKNQYFGKCNDKEYLRGFAAGIYDAEGHLSTACTTIRISNTDQDIINEITKSLDAFDFSYVIENTGHGCNKIVYNVRILQGENNANFRFASVVQPKINRKSVWAFVGGKTCRKVAVKSVNIYHYSGDVYNIGTSNHTYYANNILVHNCYEHGKCNETMPLETAKKAIDFLFDEDAKGSDYVNQTDANGIILDFIGGEPLLEIELIDQICDYFLYRALDLNHRWANRFMISMSSNGMLYFSPAVQKFMRKWDGRVNIGITIDGNKELHDSCRRTIAGEPTYDKAAAAFADAKERFHQTGTKITLSPDNLKFLSTACVDMIERFDIGELFGNPVFEAKWTTDEAWLYYSELKNLADWMINTERWKKTWVSFFDDYIGHKLEPEDNRNWCGGAGKMLAFDVDGSIYPCLRYAPLSIGDDLARNCVIGHVDTGIASNGAEKSFLCGLCAITRRSQSTDECWSCPIGSGCATCSAWQYELYGTADKRCTNICNMHKARVMATSYYFNTLYRKYHQPERFALNIPREWAIPIVGEKDYEMLISLAKID